MMPLAESVDPISGGAGWVGAGLLGLVLSWLLLKHLPRQEQRMDEILQARDRQLAEKDRHLSEVLEHKNEQQARLLEASTQQQAKLTEAYTAQIKEVTNHCREEMQMVTGMFQECAAMLRADSAKLNSTLDKLAKTIESKS